MRNVLTHPVFKVISGISAEMSIPAFVIGGYVRDAFMGRECKDIDFVVLGDGLAFAKRVAEEMKIKKEAKYFKNFGTAMIRDGDWIFEFVGARKESYHPESRNPEVESGSLEDDFSRRDFTVNAMAFDLREEFYGELLDPFNGIQDLHDGLLRTPLDPDVTFSDDPLRMMRAVRFATILWFTIVPECAASIINQADRIRIVAPERISEELNKIILSAHPGKGLRLLDEFGLLKHILPEMIDLKITEYVGGKGHKDNFRHTLEVLDNISRVSDNLWLRWAAILHDIGKPPTRKYMEGTGWTFHAHDFRGAKMIPAIFRRLRLPLNDPLRYIQKLVSLHLRPIVLSEDIVTDSAIRRLLFEAGDDIDDLMTLCEADVTSKNPQKVRTYLENFKLARQKLKEIEEKDRLRNWQPPVSGDVIMKTFNLQPSREVGIIKEAITEAILEGKIHNDFDEAYRFMLAEGEKMGLKKVE
ncbi:MAG: HD domain-containing protein [Bacteroidetes bacterium]|nr:HD domain-containing protein [Bacteroidota bacterium]